jgi:hypothetical protein
MPAFCPNLMASQHSAVPAESREPSRVEPLVSAPAPSMVTTKPFPPVSTGDASAGSDGVLANNPFGSVGQADNPRSFP